MNGLDNLGFETGFYVTLALNLQFCLNLLSYWDYRCVQPYSICSFYFVQK